MSIPNTPENTAQRPSELHMLGMTGGSESYITGMEADGQRHLVASSTLPVEGPWDELAALGFVKGEPIDDLFVTANLPAGWTKAGTDHSMHSEILDERGIARVGVFYKAAFYDRRADMHMINPGYQASTEALYGDGPPALPEKWALFTEDERTSFVRGIDRMQGDIDRSPKIYGDRQQRVHAIRALLAESVSA